jgi:hypothetical protein
MIVNAAPAGPFSGEENPQFLRIPMSYGLALIEPI